jgi:hypothetical protein
MKRFPRFLLAIVIFSLLFTACSVASRNALIGKWGNQEQALTLEFTMDGRLRQTSQGVTQELSFQFLDDQSIELKVPGATGDPQPIPFTIAGDTLSLHLGQDAAGGQPQTLEFQRVK